MKLSFLFVVLILLGYSLAIFAESENENASEPKEQVKSAEPKPTSSKRGRAKTLKEFIPSEEVSADAPVSFPSDI